MTGRENSPAYAALPRSARRVFAAIEAEIGDRSSASVSYVAFSVNHCIGRQSISRSLKLLDAVGMIEIEPGPRLVNVFRFSNRWRTIDEVEVARLVALAREVRLCRRFEKRREPKPEGREARARPIGRDSDRAACSGACRRWRRCRGWMTGGNPRVKRRHLNAGQRAMAYAMVYPEPATLRRSGLAAKPQEISKASLSQARTVLADSRHMTAGQRAMAVAMMHPEPADPSKNAMKDKTGCVAELDISKGRLSMARTVLADSRALFYSPVPPSASSALKGNLFSKAAISASEIVKLARSIGAASGGFLSRRKSQARRASASSRNAALRNISKNRWRCAASRRCQLVIIA
jgi:hypothetical protein